MRDPLSIQKTSRRPARRGAVPAAPLLAPALLALLLAACAEPPAPPAPPPPEVRVVTVRPQPIVNRIEVPGRLQAVRTAEVRARVDGIVERRLYDEGTDVAEDQPLFAIDRRELSADLAEAEAALAGARATAANAAQDVARYEGLVDQQAISRQEYDTALARLRTAEAEVAAERARVESARLDLGYTTVRAPIAGRAGRAEVTEGALVSASGATPLTRIEQIDPIYVNFALSSTEVLRLRREAASGALDLPRLDRVAVRLVLEDGSLYGPAGQLDFLDLAIDEATGSSALRAEVPNPDRALLPGQFVRVRIEAGVRPDGLLVPQRAVTVTPQGASVTVVGEGDVAEARPVELGALQGDSWLIAGGLAAGERVIVDGQQNVQPGQPVRVAAGEAGTGGRTAPGDEQPGEAAPEAGAPEADPGAAAER